MLNYIFRKKRRINYININLVNIRVLGFWIYIMSDFIFFATLFAVYIVLSDNIMYIPFKKNIFNLPLALIETILLLFSNFTESMALLAIKRNNKFYTNIYLTLTFLLGFIFLCLELYELKHLISINYRPSCNAFLSSFFTIISLHCSHVTFGLIWILIIIIKVYKNKFIFNNKINMQCFSLFWNFIDIIWICIFNLIYLMGTVNI